MPEKNSLADIQERLSSVSGKIQYLQHEKQRIEKEQEDIIAELNRLGLKDVAALKIEIERRKVSLEENKEKLLDAVGKLEVKTKALEESINV